MNDLLPVRITVLAATHIRVAKAWWQANRSAAPQAIDQELKRAFTLIASQPAAGARATDVELTATRLPPAPRLA